MLSKVKGFAQSHRASKWWSRNTNMGVSRVSVLNPLSLFFSIILNSRDLEGRENVWPGANNTYDQLGLLEILKRTKQPLTDV